MSPAPSLEPALLGLAQGPDLGDLLVKALLVGVLLVLTLRLLRRLQAAPGGPSAQIRVLESRALASRASLHLVAVGDRRLVLGQTPSTIVALTELDAAELPEAAAASGAAPFVGGSFRDLVERLRPPGRRAGGGGGAAENR